jgi:hypothetical protein
MKLKISETDGYLVWAELQKIETPAGYYSLRVTSQWHTAKDPEAEQVRFTAVLSPSAAQQYHELFSMVTA